MNQLHLAQAACAAPLIAAPFSSSLSEAWILSEAFGEENSTSISRDPSDALSRRVDVIVQPVKIMAEAIEAEERRVLGN